MPSHLPFNVATHYRPRLRVYVAGPLYSSGIVEDNVRAACRVGARLWAEGFQPFVPHACGPTWAGHAPEMSEAQWLAWDLGWLDLCHAAVRLPGRSTGSDLEEAHTIDTWTCACAKLDVSGPCFKPFLHIGRDGDLDEIVRKLRAIFPVEVRHDHYLNTP